MSAPRFRPTQQDLDRVDKDVEAMPAIQEKILNSDPQLKVADRVAHQYQIAGGRVVLTVAPQLPESLVGIGLFQPNSRHFGIGRISTGLGCPHAETNPDFLGMRLAFQTASGARVDFIGINDPTAPTDTHVEFMRLLEATAAGAGEGLAGSNLQLVKSLIDSLGHVRGTTIAAHVVKQTLRTFSSSTAYQTYWTGIVETGGALGKFVYEPVSEDNPDRPLTAGHSYLSEEWRARQASSAIEFHLYWIPFLDEQVTSLTSLTKAWKEERHEVGRVIFPQSDSSTDDARLWAALAAEMGANPGNWVRDLGNTIPEPETEFGLARKLAYRKSQEGRGVLPEADYAQVFQTGEIDERLAAELNRRREQKQSLGHVDAAP